MSLTAAELKAVYSVDEGPLDKSLSGIPGKVKATAAKVLAAGAVIGAALGAGVLSGMENERATDRTAAALGLDPAESKRAGQVAGALFAGAYAGSVGEASTAVEAVMSSISGMRNASEKDLQAVSRQALDFANIFGVDVNRAVQIAGQAISTGLAKDATEAFDLMTAASQKVPQALREDVMDAADEYGQFFAALGYDGEEAFGVLVKGAEKGMYGIDKAGDALKEFSIRATDMSKASTDAYKAIGLDAEKMANDLLAGGDTAQAATQKIIKGILGIEDPAKRANTAIALFGTPLEDLGTSEIPAFLKSLQAAEGGLGDFEGAIDKAGQTANDNASTALTEFKNTVQLAFVDFLGGKALPVVKNVAGFLRSSFGPAVSAVAGFLTGTLVPALKSSAEWVSANQTPIMIVAGLITAVFLPHLLALATASTVTGIKVAAAWAMKTAAAVAGAAAHSVAVVGMVAKWVLLGVQSMIAGAKVAAAWVLAMGPVGWVIALVAGLVALIVANWDTVKNATVTAWKAVSGAVATAWNAVKNAVAAAWGWVKSTLAGAWAWVRSTASSAWNGMVGIIRGAWNSAVGAVRGAWNTIKSAISSGISNAISLVKSLPGRILSVLGNLGSLLYNAGRDMINGLIRGAGSLLANIGRFFLDLLPGWIKKPFMWALGISSPSKVFAGYGENIGQGLVKGLHGMKPAVAAEMLRMADTSALAGLTARMPVGAAARGPLGGASSPGGPDDGGRGSLFHADSVTVIEGTPQDVARQLELGARTRGNW